MRMYVEWTQIRSESTIIHTLQFGPCVAIDCDHVIIR